MKLEVTDDEALVLFEWLARVDEAEALPVVDPPEEQVLWRLHGQLEKASSERFRADYRELVETARGRVKAAWGADPATPRVSGDEEARWAIGDSFRTHAGSATVVGPPVIEATRKTPDSLGIFWQGEEVDGVTL